MEERYTRKPTIITTNLTYGMRALPIRHNWGSTAVDSRLLVWTRCVLGPREDRRWLHTGSAGARARVFAG